MMKVDKVEVFPLYVPLSKSISAPVSLPHAEKIENIVFGGYRATVIRIYTDEGLVGIGECMTRLAPLALKAIIDEISPVIIGSDPMHPEAIWEILYSIMMNRGHNRGFFIEAISGIDIALWDIRAKALKQPMYMMFGGRQREKIWSYASSVRIREKSVVLDTVRSFLDKGFNAMKIKIGKDPFNYLQDLRLIEDIRAEVDDEVMLTADANCAYHEDVKLALRVGKALETLGLYWFEEPISPDNLAGYRRLCENLNIAIAAGESSFTRYDFAAWFGQRALDIVQPNTCRAGGITEMRKIASMSQAFHIPFAPHTGSCSAVCLALQLHIATALPNFLIFEYMQSDWAKEEPNPLRHELVQETFEQFENGYLKAPPDDKYGIGIELNEEILRRFTIS
jgi:D-arabinonate dehydratase/D-galactarolactone cycloisomerase